MAKIEYGVKPDIFKITDIATSSKEPDVFAKQRKKFPKYCLQYVVPSREGNARTDEGLPNAANWTC